MTAQYFLLTPRLGFRSWSDADIELAMSLWGDPEVTALFDSRGRLSREQVQERLTRELDSERELGVQYWPFFLRETGEFVGCAGLKPYDAARGFYELGFTYLRDEHFAGTGLLHPLYELRRPSAGPD